MRVRAVTRRGQTTLLTVVAATCLIVVVALQMRLSGRPSLDTGDTLPYGPSGPLLERLSLSYDALMADVYWIRAIQYFGGTRRSSDPDKGYGRLYPLLDRVTTLDPDFNIAYRFGSIFLAEVYPDGPGRPDQAIALLKKGFAARPDRWQYLQDIGFVHYWWLQDYEAAAEWFLRASEVPGSSWWLETLAATTLAQGGDREASRVLWQHLAADADADNAWLRQEAVRRLAQLTALDDIDALAATVDEFARRAQAFPTTWQLLVDADALPGVPVDPAGVPYALDPTQRRVDVSSESPLFPLPGAAPPLERLQP